MRVWAAQTDLFSSVCRLNLRSRALSDHLNRYKLSVEQARQRHPEYFTEGTVRPVDYHI